MITCDAHIDVPWQMTRHGVFDLRRDGRFMVDFPKMKEGGLQSAIFALYLSDAMQDRLGQYCSDGEIENQIYHLRQQGCRIVTRSAEAIKAGEIGEIPIFLGLEGGRLINRSLDRLRKLHGEGIVYLTLTHNKHTSWADSATDAPYHNGLTNFGYDVIAEANRLGILIDVSHASDKTCEDVLGSSISPIIASHSACNALVKHPRNLTDSLILYIASTGGVIHVPFARRFIGPKYTQVADHIDHIVQLVGNTEHVGIGSDLDGADMADGIADASSWRKVVMDMLANRGYVISDIERIAGGNTMRLLV